MTEVKNPCLKCDWHLSGGDKNTKKCGLCAERWAYAKSIDPRIPIIVPIDGAAAPELSPDQPQTKRRGRPPKNRTESIAQAEQVAKRRYVKAKTTKVKAEEDKVSIKMKTCRSDRCEHAGQAQPVENFMRSKMSRDGYMHLCKLCYSAQVRDRVGLKSRTGTSLEIRFDKRSSGPGHTAGAGRSGR